MNPGSSEGMKDLVSSPPRRALQCSRGSTPDVLRVRAALRSFARGCKLLSIERLVQAALLQQLGMCSPFDDAPPIHDRDHICCQDRAEPVRDPELVRFRIGGSSAA